MEATGVKLFGTFILHHLLTQSTFQSTSYFLFTALDYLHKNRKPYRMLFRQSLYKEKNSSSKKKKNFDLFGKQLLISTCRIILTYEI